MLCILRPTQLQHSGEELQQQLLEELAFAREHVVAAPHNPSSWNFLKGLWQLQPSCAALQAGLQELCEEVSI